MQRVKCDSDLNEEKVFGAFRRCPASRAYSPLLEPPVKRVVRVAQVRWQSGKVMVLD